MKVGDELPPLLQIVGKKKPPFLEIKKMKAGEKKPPLIQKKNFDAEGKEIKEEK